MRCKMNSNSPASNLPSALLWEFKISSTDKGSPMTARKPHGSSLLLSVKMWGAEECGHSEPVASKLVMSVGFSFF